MWLRTSTSTCLSNADLPGVAQFVTAFVMFQPKELPLDRDPNSPIRPRRAESEASPQLARLGLCGWNGSQRDYFKEFPTIEIQTTFYDLPAVRVAERWRAIAPPTFTFCIKAWQVVTHTAESPTYRRLRKPLPDADRPLVGAFQLTPPVLNAWERTLAIAHAADAKVILLQCPKSFLPTSQNLSNFTSFFRRISRGPFTIAWEPRGDAWSDDLVRELCQEFDLVHCVDPLMAGSVSEEMIYWRLHGIGSYSYRYTDSNLLRLKRLLVRNGRPGYVMFNNFSSKVDALRFREILTAR